MNAVTRAFTSTVVVGAGGAPISFDQPVGLRPRGVTPDLSTCKLRGSVCAHRNLKQPLAKVTNKKLEEDLHVARSSRDHNLWRAGSGSCNVMTTVPRLPLQKSKKVACRTAKESCRVCRHVTFLRSWSTFYFGFKHRVLNIFTAFKKHVKILKLLTRFKANFKARFFFFRTAYLWHFRCTTTILQSTADKLTAKLAKFRDILQVLCTSAAGVF